MGKLAKPQRSKKHKKLKCVDPFYVGSRKDVRQAACNQKPTNCEQEVPKKLRHLGFSIDGVRSGQVGKKSRNKFLKHPDAPHKYNNQFSTVLGTKASSRKNEPKKHSADNSGKAQQLKKHKKRFMPKISEKDVSDFIDNLQPPRPYTESFTFKKQSQETDSKFMRRVHEETNRALTKTQIDEQLEMSDKRKLLLKLKPKKGMSDKKKERLKDKKKKKVQAVRREKRHEKNLDFGSLKDSIQFGDVVHAPPVLSVRPKKAAGPELDRPGLRMPELKAIIDGHKEQASSAMAKPGHSVTEKQTRPVGKSIKRKAMSKVEQHLADVQRDSFISAYRQRKQGQLSLLE